VPSIKRLADRIAKGADSATLPIELPTIIELVLNLRTARALKVKVPQGVLVRAQRINCASIRLRVAAVQHLHPS